MNLTNNVLLNGTVTNERMSIKRMKALQMALYVTQKAFADYKKKVTRNLYTNNWLKMHNRPMRRNRALK